MTNLTTADERFKQVTVPPFALGEGITVENALTKDPSQIMIHWHGGKLYLEVSEARRLREFLDMVLP